MTREDLISGILLDENFRLTFVEVCQLCDVSAETVIALVNEGVVEISMESEDPHRWQFDAIAFQRLKTALRLERDLGVNPAGAALVLDLLEELEDLRRRW